mmetsp:Transcript_24081/g.58157  ORF Transcript_24081/g.58157 Transcript_24081/m.58157 type:complete len:368 (+) Transcript_24081:96-1199(+)
MDEAPVDSLESLALQKKPGGQQTKTRVSWYSLMRCIALIVLLGYSLSLVNFRFRAGIRTDTGTSKVVPRCPTYATLQEMLTFASMQIPTSKDGKQEQKGIVFTTVTIDKGTASHVEWVSNWYHQLQNVGVHHPIVFGADDTGETCRIVQSAGMCCRNFQPADFTSLDEDLLILLNTTRDGQRPPAVDIKFFYAFQLLSYGYRISFSDDDVFWFKHPFVDNEFDEDMRGLTDDRSNDEQPDGWTSTSCGLEYGSPCMSTGLWDIYPTDSSINFILGLLGGLKTTRMWEQQLANEYLKNERYKDGDGKMSFRLFPKITHLNVGVLDQRVANNQDVNLTAVHLGYVHGANKLVEYKKRGYWNPGNISIGL